MLYSKIEGAGRPLIILHGFLGMSDNWKTLQSKYAEAGFQAHALDLRNHGRSLHSADFSYTAMVNDLLEYCDGNQLTQIDIIGHSMGGKVAMFFAMAHPERIRKLIVADIAPRYYSPHHDEILEGLNAVDFAKKPGRNDVDEILARFIPDMGTRQFLMKSLYWKEPTQLAFRFNLSAFNNELDAIGEAIQEGKVFEGETLFLKGDRSQYITESDHAAIFEHFPKAKIEVIKNAGHWLHAENPQDFLTTTLNFLQ